jgi:hypothetical protein
MEDSNKVYCSDCEEEIDSDGDPVGETVTALMDPLVIPVDIVGVINPVNKQHMK